MKNANIEHEYFGGIKDFSTEIIPKWLDEAKKYLAYSRQANFIIEPDGVYLEDGESEDETDFKQISNFVPVVLNNIIDKSTVTESRRIEIAGIMGGKILKPVIIDENEFSNDRWIAKNWGFGCVIYGKYNLIKNLIKDMAFGCAREKSVYNYLGWEVNTDTKRYLLADGAITSAKESRSTSKSISFSKNFNGYTYMRKEVKKIRRYECDDYIFKIMLEVAGHNITYTSLAFALLSLIKSLFDGWFFKPDFVYMLLGKTGSMKTTIEKLFFNMYSKFAENVPLNFQATLAAMERLYTEFRDTTLLIDDICPVIDRAEKRRRDDKFENIIRAIGDNIARQKILNGIETELKISCLICFTGEDVPTKSPSTLARLFIVNMAREDVNIEKLTEAQENRILYTTFITEYIRHICSRKEYLNHFKGLFQRNRREFENVQQQQIHGRFLNAFAWLMTSFEMFLFYEQQKGYLTSSDYKNMKEEFRHILLSISKEQEQLNQDNDIIHTFVDAFNQMRFTQTLSVSKIGTVGKKICTLSPATHNTVGYYDEVYYYFLPNVLYKKICSFYSSGSSVFPWSQRELLNSLKKEGILVTDKSESKTVHKTIDETRMRLLRLDAARIENFYNEMGD